MKVVAIFVVILIAIGFGGYFLLNKQGALENTLFTTFLVTELQDQALFQKPSDASFREIEKEATVPFETRIKTTQTGRALLEAGETIITTIDRNSEFTVHEYGESASSLALHTGNLWSRVEKTLEKGEFYEIKTKNAVATVRGTSFGTSFVGGIMTIIVTDGIVSAYLVDEAGIIIKDSRKEIPAGKKAVIGDTIRLTDLSNEDRQTEWYLFNINNPKRDVSTQNTLPTVSPTAQPPSSQNPTVSIISILPAIITIDSGNSTMMTLVGSGFAKLKSFTINKQPISAYQTVSDSQIQFLSSLLGLREGKNEFDIQLIAQDNSIAVARIVLTISSMSTETLSPNEAPVRNMQTP